MKKILFFLKVLRINVGMNNNNNHRHRQLLWQNIEI